MGRIRAHLTYANVVSSIALFAVLGGGAYAADTVLPASSVGTVQLKDRSITGRKLAPGLKTVILRRAGSVITGRTDRLSGIQNGISVGVSGENSVAGGYDLSPAATVRASALAVKIVAPETGSHFVRVSLVVNGNLTALSCTITAPNQTCVDNAHTVTVGPASDWRMLLDRDTPDPPVVSPVRWGFTTR